VTLLYLDASALVKLVRDEPESDALDRYLDGADIISSEIAIVELMRAARRAPLVDPRLDGELLAQGSAELLESVALLPVERDVLLRAAGLEEPFLRALDAIHIASALVLDELDAFVSYDERQSAAARIAGLRTTAPAPG
jgi:predicted nucleic acid-binding protein